MYTQPYLHSREQPQNLFITVLPPPPAFSPPSRLRDIPVLGRILRLFTNEEPSPDPAERISLVEQQTLAPQPSPNLSPSAPAPLQATPKPSYSPSITALIRRVFSPSIYRQSPPPEPALEQPRRSISVGLEMPPLYLRSQTPPDRCQTAAAASPALANAKSPEPHLVSERYKTAIHIRSALTDLRIPETLIDAILTGWETEWRDWVECSESEGREVFRQTHRLARVKVHRDRETGQMCVDIARDLSMHGTRRSGKGMARLLADGNMHLLFRYHPGDTPEDLAAVETEFTARNRLKEAWMAQGTANDTDPLDRYLVLATKEAHHISSRSGKVVTRFLFEMAQGTLCNLMRDADEEPLHAAILDKNLRESLKICLDTVEGLALLHSRGFVHMDIQPKNILRVMGRGKLSDFETLRHVREEFKPGGTFPYTAPELFHQMDSLQHNDPSMDMFSFGVMLLEVLSPSFGAEMHDICISACPMCREPDEGPADTHEQTKAKIERIQAILRKKGEPWTLVAALIDIDPAKRPTSAETRERLDRAFKTLPRKEFRYHTATAR